MSMMYVGIGSAVLGAGTAIYGANKSAKAQQAAIDANKQAQDETNRLNYQRWLESQGVGPDGQPINTWLPRYAMVRRPVQLAPGFEVFGSRMGQPKFMASSVGSNGVPNRAPATLGSLGGGAGGTSYGDLLRSMPQQPNYDNLQ